MADINTGSMHQSIVRSFDEASETLKVTVANAQVTVDVTALTDSIAIADDSGNKVTTTLVGAKRSLDVNVTDITLDKSNDSVATESIEQAFRSDDASSTVSYFGYAPVGSSESSSVWKIKRLTVSGSTSKVEYADGNTNYDNNWSNRASLTYV